MNGLFEAKNAEINRLRDRLNALQARLERGRDYLMGVNPADLTVEDALEAFGWQRNGLREEVGA